MEMCSTCPDSFCKFMSVPSGYCTYKGPCIYSTAVNEPKGEEGVLTKIGYDQIIERIVNRTVEPPTDKNCVELNAWLQGYADCQSAVLDIILRMKDQYGR